MSGEKSSAPARVLVDNAAPFVFFEGVAAFGAVNGVYRLLLAAGRPVPMTDGGMGNENILVAQLQGNREALLNLRDAIDGALLIAATPEGPAN